MKKRGAALVLLFGLACFLAGGAVATANLPGAVDRLTEVLSREQGAAACPPALPTQPYPTNVTGGDAPTALLAVLAALTLLALLAGLGAVVVRRRSAL